MKGISIDKIPKKGLVMAYFRNELLFLPYEVVGDELKMPGELFLTKRCPMSAIFLIKIWSIALSEENQEMMSILGNPIR